MYRSQKGELWRWLTNKVTVLEIETVQLVARCLRVHNIFVDYKRGSLGVVCYSLANLTLTRSQHMKEFKNEIETYRIGPNFPKRSNSSSEETL